LAAVGVDLALDDVLELTEVGRDVEVQALAQLGDLGLRRAHLEVGVVLLDLVLDLDELLVGVLDLLEVVVVRRLVHRQLLAILLERGLGLGQLEREAAGGLAIAGLEIRLGLRGQLVDLVLAVLDLAADALDQRAVLLEPLTALLELLDRQVVLVLHLGDRIRFPEEVGEFVELSPDRTKELAEDHREASAPEHPRPREAKGSYVPHITQPNVVICWPRARGNRTSATRLANRAT